MTAIDQTLAFLQFVTSPGDVIELRALADNRVYSGRFNEMALLARNAHGLQREYADNIYFTINPLNPEAMHIGDVAINKVARVTKRTAGDRDIYRRMLYMIDIDPVRPKGVCATDAEREDAGAIASAVQAYMTERGWPEPVVVDSGNGFHLYFRGDGCNPVHPAWVYILKALSAQFSTAGATVDTAVGNAARIGRLVGTVNRKGPDTPERPHRLCQAVSYPTEFIPVQAPQVYKLARELGFEDVSRRTVHPDGDRPALVDEPGEAIAAFIAEYPEQLEVAHVYERNGDTYWALKTCPFVGRAHRGSALKTAIRLTDTAVGFCCWSDECAGKGMRDLKDLLYEQTGRRSQVRFYQRDEQADADARFNRDLEEYYVRMDSAVRYRADVMYDQATWDRGATATIIDPTLYGLDYDALAAPFRAWALNAVGQMEPGEAQQFTASCTAAKASEDVYAMGAILGAADLWRMYREINRPVEAGPRWWETLGDPLLNAQQMRYALAEYLTA